MRRLRSDTLVIYDSATQRRSHYLLVAQSRSGVLRLMYTTRYPCLLVRVDVYMDSCAGIWHASVRFKSAWTRTALKMLVGWDDLWPRKCVGLTMIYLSP
jgi:hypothetical protein